MHHCVVSDSQLPVVASEFAHHLQSAIASCVEFAARTSEWDEAPDADQLRRVELKAILHLVQARDCARETSRLDPRLTECVDLFLQGTDPLEQAAAMRCNELLLGGRMTVATAIQLAELMLQACSGVVTTRAEGAAPDSPETSPARPRESERASRTRPAMAA